MLSRGESGSLYTNTNSPTHSMLYWYGLVFGGSVPAVTEQAWAVTEKSWEKSDETHATTHTYKNTKMNM